MEELITIEQQAVLSQRFDEVSAALDQRVKTAENMVVSEENYKDAKKIRADIRKEAKEYADAFRNVRAQVLDPWNKIEKEYKEKIAQKYDRADVVMRDKINEITDGIKDQKRETVEAYFDEAKKAAGLDSLTFGMAGIKVNMSDSVEGLKKQVDAFVSGIAADIEAIGGMDDAADVMTEYKRNGFDLARAQTSVRIRKEEEARQAEYLEKRRATQEEADRRRREAVEHAKEAELDAPTVEPPEEAAPAEEAPKMYRATFTVTGTKDQLRALVAYMRESGIGYEQIRR